MNSQNKTYPILAISACLYAAVLWGLLWYPLRIMELQGLPGLWATLAIYVPASIVVIGYVLAKQIPMPKQYGLLFCLALAAGWTNLAFILAMLEGTVVRVLLLFYLSPVWTILLSRLFFYEPISRIAFLHLCLAFIGALILLWTDQFSLNFSQADWLAISSGFGFALTNVLVRKIGNIPIAHKMSSAFIGVIVLCVIGLIAMSDPAPHAATSAWFIGLLVGVFGMILMTYCAQYGVTHLPLHQSATLFLFEVPAGAISAAILSNEVMSGREWIGGLLVLLAAWLSARSTINHSRNVEN